MDKTLLNRLCECYQTHMLRGCVKYLDGIFGVGKIVFAEQTAVIFCLFFECVPKDAISEMHFRPLQQPVM